MKRRIRSRVFAAGLLALLARTPGLEATRYAPARIASDNIIAHQGKVVFVSPDGGVTVLDAATGAVRLRTAPPRKDGGRHELFRTDAGVLVSAWTAFRMIDLARPAVAWTLDGCDGWFHLTPQGLICVSSEGSPAGTGVRFVLHRLTDGRPLWTHRASARDAGELLHGRGRLLLTYEDQGESETRPFGTAATLTQPVRRVVGLTVLDLASGRELLPHTTQDVKLDPVARQPIRFDGERITYVLPRATDGSCRGERRRVLTLNAAASAYTARERCLPVPQEEPAPMVGERTRQLPSGTITLGAFVGGTLVDVRSGGRRWLAGIPADPRLVPTIREDGGLFFLETVSGEEGRLDALDIETRRPRWTYAFASHQRMVSTSSFLSHPVERPMGDAAWPGVRPPKGAFPVSLSAPQAQGRAAPVVVEPPPAAWARP